MNLLLADKHALSSAGFKALISLKEDLELIEEVNDQKHLQEALEKHQPDLLIVD